MTEESLRTILESIGLDSLDAQIYLAGLKLGLAPASAYANETKANRITVYNNLETLTKMGIFERTKKARSKHYQPISPDDLLVRVQKNAVALERSIPELRGLRGSDYRKPHVKYYEGKEGIARVYQDTLNAESEILNFANSEIVRTFWKEYDKEYVKKRVKKKIALRGIAPDDSAGRKVQGKDKQSLREIRLVDAEEFAMNNEISIYDNKIAIVSFSEDESQLFGVIIESKEVAETQKMIFEMAWRFAGQEGGRDPKARKDQMTMF